MTRVLVLCTGNSCRSQMMHGFLETYPDIEIYSAGVEIHGLNPSAVRVMAEVGVDISDHTSNNVTEYLDLDFDRVITVCDNARERCPIFPGGTQMIHHSFEDPARAEGTEQERLAVFRSVRDQIRKYTEDLAQSFAD